MQDRIQLHRQHRVDRGDVAIERVAQRLMIDPQPGAAIGAEPVADRLAGPLGQSAGL